MSDVAKIKVEFPTWDSLSEELQTIITNGIANAKVWCIHALDDYRNSLASEMSIQFNDLNNENKFYYIQLSEDQTPHSSSDVFAHDWDEDDNPVYTNNKPVCLKTLNAYLVHQDKFPYEEFGGGEVMMISAQPTRSSSLIKNNDRDVESDIQTERVCPVVVKLMINNVENTTQDFLPVIKDERLDGYTYGDEQSQIYSFSFEIESVQLKDQLVDDELDELNKLGFIQTRFGFDDYNNRYSVLNKDFVECVYLKISEAIPENLIDSRGYLISSNSWTKLSESLYEFDGNDLILHINDIRSNFTVDYSSQLSILYDAEKLKTAGVVEEVTGELSIIQSPWLFASSEMDYISYYSNSKKRYPAVKAILNYNTLRLLHNELNFSTKELEPSEYDVADTVFYADAVQDRGLRFLINGRRYGIVGFKELPTESKELTVDEDLIRNNNDLTLRFTGTNRTVTAYVYEIPTEDDITYSSNIIKLCFNKNFYTPNGNNNGVTPVLNRCSSSSSVTSYYCQNLYTSETTTDSSTIFVMDNTKRYTLLDINCYGTLMEANDTPSTSFYHYMRDSRNALKYSGDYCIEMQSDSKVFLGNAQYYETKLYHYVLYYLVENAE